MLAQVDLAHIDLSDAGAYLGVDLGLNLKIIINLSLVGHGSQVLVVHPSS